MIAANDAPYVKRQVARGRGRALLRITCAFLVGLFLVRAAEAQDQAKTQAAINKTQAKLSVCIAYFSIFKECSAGDEKDLSLADLAINGLGKKSHAAANAVGMSSWEFGGSSRGERHEKAPPLGDKANDGTTTKESAARECVSLVRRTAPSHVCALRILFPKVSLGHRALHPRRSADLRPARGGMSHHRLPLTLGAQAGFRSLRRLSRHGNDAACRGAACPQCGIFQAHRRAELHHAA